MPDLITPRRFPPVKRCIYCGAEGDDILLTDEHIVPFALDGRVVLPEASCKSCAHITGATVEQQVLRRMFGITRIERGLPTRRPKERPTKFRVTADFGSHKEEREEEIRHHPPIFSMPVFKYPTILSDLPPEESDSVTYHMWTVLNPVKVKEFVDRHKDAEKITVYREHNPYMFASMLAKIGHSFAVAEYGFNFEPLLLSLIFGKENHVHFNHLVGSIKLFPPKTKELHDIRLIRIRTIWSGTEYLVAEIRLFSDLGAPVYLVVVGPSAGLGEPLRVQQV